MALPTEVARTHVCHRKDRYLAATTFYPADPPYVETVIYKGRMDTSAVESVAAVVWDGVARHKTVLVGNNTPNLIDKHCFAVAMTHEHGLQWLYGRDPRWELFSDDTQLVKIRVGHATPIDGLRWCYLLDVEPTNVIEGSYYDLISRCWKLRCAGPCWSIAGVVVADVERAVTVKHQPADVVSVPLSSLSVRTSGEFEDLGPLTID